MSIPAEQVSDALGAILQRSFRSALYEELVRGVHPAVDASAYPVLSAIARYGPMSAAALGAEVGLDRSIVSRRAAALAEAGLLRGRPDPDDARATLLTLTAKGDRGVAKMRARLVEAIDERLAGWDAADRRRFASLLERFAAEPLGVRH